MFDWPKELKDLKKSNFKFAIVPAEEGQEKIVFEIRNDGAELLRQNISKQFRSGAIIKEWDELDKSDFVVKVDNRNNLNLEDLGL